jgi:hypothetical protein
MPDRRARERGLEKCRCQNSTQTPDSGALRDNRQSSKIPDFCGSWAHPSAHEKDGIEGLESALRPARDDVHGELLN